MRSVLLVEDDAALRVDLWDRLVEEGYRVTMAADAGEALSRAAAETFDLVVLDAALPGPSGLDACRELRRRGFDGGVVLLCDGPDPAERVVGLRLGADDCLAKPVDVAELLARAEACLRRGPTNAAAGGVCRFGRVEVDLRGARVLREGREVSMSPREYQLLRCFVEHAGTPLSRDQLLDRAWGHDAMPSPRTVDVHVAWLRHKLEADPRRPTLIRTVHGIGYLFTGGSA